MSKYSFLNLARHALNGHRGWDPAWREPSPKGQYDIIIIGGWRPRSRDSLLPGPQHGVTRIAVLERGWIGGGNSGRNTQLVRSNYFYPVSSAFYDHSLRLYEGLGPRAEFQHHAQPAGSRIAGT